MQEKENSAFQTSLNKLHQNIRPKTNHCFYSSSTGGASTTRDDIFFLIVSHVIFLHFFLLFFSEYDLIYTFTYFPVCNIKCYATYLFHFFLSLFPASPFTFSDGFSYSLFILTLYYAAEFYSSSSISFRLPVFFVASFFIAIFFLILFVRFQNFCKGHIF